MADITMSIDDTLELDAIIEKSNSIKNAVTYDSNEFELTGIQTHTGIFDPKKTGTHSIEINGQILNIEVIDTTIIPDTGVSKWSFEQSLNDVWENGTTYNGSKIGTINYTSSSQNGDYALQLNGSDAYVDFGQDIGLDPNGPFSVSGWVKMNETPDRATLLSGFSSDTDGTSFDIEISSYVGKSTGDGAFGVHTWGGYVSSDPDKVASVGNWEHYVATYSGGDLNGSNISLYVGGSEISTTRVDPNTNDLSNNQDNFEIGYSSKNTSNINLQSMDVDSVKTYTKELNATEVDNLYQNGKIQ